MSQFTTPLKVEVLDKFKFRVIEPFIYFVGDLNSDEYITVPQSFTTDFASIPRSFWSILPPHGKYAKASVLHDWMYNNAYKSKEYADHVFYEAMGVLGVHPVTRWMIYQSVKLFGKGKY